MIRDDDLMGRLQWHLSHLLELLLHAHWALLSLPLVLRSLR
jgi:hypothetical protein